LNAIMASRFKVSGACLSRNDTTGPTVAGNSLVTQCLHERLDSIPRSFANFQKEFGRLLASRTPSELSHRRQ